VTDRLGYEGAADWFDRWTALNRRARTADASASPPYFPDLLLDGFRRCAPGPPPLSVMNLIPTSGMVTLSPIAFAGSMSHPADHYDRSVMRRAPNAKPVRSAARFSPGRLFERLKSHCIRSTILFTASCALLRSALPNLIPLTAQFASKIEVRVFRSTNTPTKASQSGSAFLTASVIAACISSREIRSRLSTGRSIENNDKTRLHLTFRRS
jgi:hypothetical protein